MGKPRSLSLTILNAAAVTDEFPFQGQRVMGVVTPGTWTAADVTFEVEEPAGTFVKVVDRAGVIYKVTGIATGTSEFHLVSGDANQADVIITGTKNGRVVSTNTANEGDTNQGGERVIVVYLVDV